MRSRLRYDIYAYNSISSIHRSYYSLKSAALLNHAKKLGVKIRQPCGAEALLLRTNRVVGVKTSLGALYATFVVDATGSHHWLARQLKLPITYYSPRLIARYGYATGEIFQSSPAIAADN
ncbi:NAD(P)/FAD-dependent oxidoreductase [Chroogloeocystis siderophila]|uniref:NAD(P)/FAD-dependent oxidoreductase n=1 Tax=Chroogloeocystis siderophila TaxID=329163 RepID=UPI0015B78F2D|nr:hypothetical protein [Chroogloeocystis siderophila]